VSISEWRALAAASGYKKKRVVGCYWTMISLSHRHWRDLKRPSSEGISPGQDDEQEVSFRQGKAGTGETKQRWNHAEFVNTLNRTQKACLAVLRRPKNRLAGGDKICFKFSTVSSPGQIPDVLVCTSTSFVGRRSLAPLASVPQHENTFAMLFCGGIPHDTLNTAVRRRATSLHDSKSSEYWPEKKPSASPPEH